MEETGIESRLRAVETIEFPFDFTLENVSVLNLSICLDTRHVMVGFSGPVQLFDAFEQVLPRLGEIHLPERPVKPLYLYMGI